MKRIAAVLAGIGLSVVIGMPVFAAAPVNTSAAFSSWLSSQGSLSDARRGDARKAYALITDGNTSGIEMRATPRVPLSTTFAQTDLTDSSDATNIELLSKSMDAVQKCNELRAGEGKSPYSISSTLMAIGDQCQLWGYGLELAYRDIQYRRKSRLGTARRKRGLLRLVRRGKTSRRRPLSKHRV